MKFDMHCHTAEGSMDARITLKEYVAKLKELGYDGMLITDHDSYNGYRYYQKHRNDPAFKDFVILKGIEYDTIDAGHILVIVPETINAPIIELRGLPVKMLIKIVHNLGGILGPAHPCGEKFLSLCNTGQYRKNHKILQQFDFIELFNPCEPQEANDMAAVLAKRFNLPGFGGSDSHKLNCVGHAYTEFYDAIYSESDLIAYVKAKRKVKCGGRLYHGTTREKIGFFNHFLVYSFWFYNRGSALWRKTQRTIALEAYRLQHATAEMADQAIHYRRKYIELPNEE